MLLIFSTILDVKFLKLWKEFLILTIFLFSIFIIKKNNSKKDLYVVLAILFFFIIEIFYSKNVRFPVILYQLKLDGSIIFYIFALQLFAKENKENYFLTLYTKIIKITLYLGLVNAIVIITQYFFFEEFLNLIGLKYGNWGSSLGIKIITAMGKFRAIGLFSGFVPAGAVMLLCIILIFENRNRLKFNRLFLYAMMFLYFIALLYTTYKNSIIGLIFYIFIKLIELIKNKKLSNILIYISSLIGFIFFFLSTHFYFIYNVIKKFNSYYAYNSFYMRINLHAKILNQITNPIKAIFGVGLGVNGTFGLNKKQYGLSPIPTDSTYIYLVSNYGFIIFFLVLVLLILAFLKLNSNKKYDLFGARYMLLYMFVIEIFFNNFVVSFPANILLATCIILSLDNVMKNKSKNDQLKLKDT